jgi:carbamate kinase
MRVVAALGGNALLERGQAITAEHQLRNTRRAARALSALLDTGHQLVVTHGNGPQVGLLALQAMDRPDGFPLDVLGAETEGMIGYMIEQQLRTLRPHGSFAALLTQIEVDPLDPAFAAPRKPIGPQYSKAEAERLAAQFGWSIAPDGAAYRRVVASPAPKRILELETILLLVKEGVTVICAGGGGIPVVVQPEVGWRGVEAVIDKDSASGLLAAGISADALLLLTDVKGVYRDWGRRGQSILDTIDISDLEALKLEAGSLAPKVSAAARFAMDGGLAVIGSMDDAAAMLNGTSGTRIVGAREKSAATALKACSW